MRGEMQENRQVRRFSGMCYHPIMGAISRQKGLYHIFLLFLLPALLTCSGVSCPLYTMVLEDKEQK